MWCVWSPVAFSTSGHCLLSVPSVFFVMYRVQKSMHQLTPGTCREAVLVPLPCRVPHCGLPLDSADWAYSHFQLAFPPNWLLDGSWLPGLPVCWPSVSAKRMVHRVNAPASETQTATNHSCFIIYSTMMAYPHIHADLLIFCYPNCVCHMFTLISIELLSIELSSFTWLKKR